MIKCRLIKIITACVEASGSRLVLLYTVAVGLHMAGLMGLDKQINNGSMDG